jgi:hypothetical protein
MYVWAVERVPWPNADSRRPGHTKPNKPNTAKITGIHSAPQSRDSRDVDLSLLHSGDCKSYTPQAPGASARRPCPSQATCTPQLKTSPRMRAGSSSRRTRRAASAAGREVPGCARETRVDRGVASNSTKSPADTTKDGAHLLDDPCARRDRRLRGARQVFERRAGPRRLVIKHFALLNGDSSGCCVENGHGQQRWQFQEAVV